CGARSDRRAQAPGGCPAGAGDVRARGLPERGRAARSARAVEPAGPCIDPTARSAQAAMTGLTFDTGALIGLERRRHAIRKVFVTAIENDVPIVVPTVAIAEWWRRGAREKERTAILRAVRIEALGTHIAKLAGIAIGLVPGAGTIDAIVMAAAALRG